jgi:hypothetical protein
MLQITEPTCSFEIAVYTRFPLSSRLVLIFILFMQSIPHCQYKSTLLNILEGCTSLDVSISAYSFMLIGKGNFTVYEVKYFIENRSGLKENHL